MLAGTYPYVPGDVWAGVSFSGDVKAGMAKMDLVKQMLQMLKSQNKQNLKLFSLTKPFDDGAVIAVYKRYNFYSASVYAPVRTVKQGQNQEEPSNPTASIRVDDAAITNPDQQIPEIPEPEYASIWRYIVFVNRGGTPYACLMAFDKNDEIKIVANAKASSFGYRNITGCFQTYIRKVTLSMGGEIKNTYIMSSPFSLIEKDIYKGAPIFSFKGSQFDRSTNVINQANYLIYNKTTFKLFAETSGILGYLTIFKGMAENGTFVFEFAGHQIGCNGESVYLGGEVERRADSNGVLAKAQLRSYKFGIPGKDVDIQENIVTSPEFRTTWSASSIVEGLKLPGSTSQILNGVTVDDDGHASYVNRFVSEEVTVGDLQTSYHNSELHLFSLNGTDTKVDTEKFESYYFNTGNIIDLVSLSGDKGKRNNKIMPVMLTSEKDHVSPQSYHNTFFTDYAIAIQRDVIPDGNLVGLDLSVSTFPISPTNGIPFLSYTAPNRVLLTPYGMYSISDNIYGMLQQPYDYQRFKFQRYNYKIPVGWFHIESGEKAPLFQGVVVLTYSTTGAVASRDDTFIWMNGQEISEIIAAKCGCKKNDILGMMYCPWQAGQK